MAAKKLTPPRATNPPVPPIPSIPLPPGLTSTTTTTTTTVPPSQPKPTTTGGTSKLVKVAPTKTRYGEVSYEQLPGDPVSQIKTQGRAIKDLFINAPVGLGKFIVGGSIDIGKGTLELGSKLIPGVNFEAGRLGTTEELIESAKRTGGFLKNLVKSGSTISQLGTVTPSGYGRMLEEQKSLNAFPEHYMAALEANQSILPFIIEDFGNISMAGSIYSGLARGAVRGVTLGEAAATSERAAAAQLLDEAIPGTAEAAAAAERLAKAEANVTRIANAKQFFNDQMQIGKNIERYANKVGALPFKPYSFGTRKLLSLYRDGIYLGPEGRYARWGMKASQGYVEQARKLVDEGVSPDDPRVVDLLNKSVKAGRRATSRELMKQVREAKRDAENESGSATRAVTDQIREPLHKDAINPETGEAYGELNADEVAAILAIQGGNGQIINRIASRYNLPPRVLALLGRYDFYPEFSLSERAAELAYDFLNYNPDAPGRMTPEQYERLAHAAENVAQNVFRSMIERASRGYGRRNPLPPEQLVPTPFVNELERNIIQSIRQAQQALAKEARKKTPDKAEIARLKTIVNDREMVLESWITVKESGVLDLAVDHPDRIAVLKGFVDQLPIELALDPTMYSATMRVPVEFYRRIRRGLAATILGETGGPEVLPEGDGGGPRLTPPKFTKEGAVEAELSKRRNKAKAIEKQIENVAEKIDKKEAEHAKLVERILRYDIVDAFIAGNTVEQIAASFETEVSIVEEILNKSQAARSHRRAVELKKTVDELRSKLTQEEIDSIPELQAEVAALVAEANAAQAEHRRIMQLAEQERQQIESAADDLNEELYDLEEEMGDYEDAYEAEGGVVDDLWDPEETPSIDLTGTKDVDTVLDDVFKKHNDVFPARIKINRKEINSNFPTEIIESKVDPKTGNTYQVELTARYDNDGNYEGPYAISFVAKIKFKDEDFRDEIVVHLNESRVAENSVEEILGLIQNAREIIQQTPENLDDARSNMVQTDVDLPSLPNEKNLNIDQIESLLDGVDFVENKLREYIGLPPVPKSKSPRSGKFPVTRFGPIVKSIFNDFSQNKSPVKGLSIDNESYWSHIRLKVPGSRSMHMDIGIASPATINVSKRQFINEVNKAIEDFREGYARVLSGEKYSFSTGTGGVLIHMFIWADDEKVKDRLGTFAKADVEGLISTFRDIANQIIERMPEDSVRVYEEPKSPKTTPALKPIPEPGPIPKLKSVEGDTTPFKKLSPSWESLRKAKAEEFDKSFDSFEQIVAPQAGWKRGDVELYRPSDIPGDEQIQERFLPYVKSEKYAESHYLYSFYNDNPNSIILAIDVSPNQFVPHSERIFIAVPETWQEFVEILKKKIDPEATGKWKTAQNKLKKILAIAEAQVAKGETTIYRRDKAAASIPNEKQLELVKDYIHHYNRVRDELAQYRKDYKKAVAKKESKEKLDRYARDIETSQTSLADYKKQIEDAYPFIDAEKLLDLYKDFTFFDDPLSAYENVDTEAVELLDPESVIQPYGDQYPETLSADEYNALKPFRKVFDTGEFVKEYKEAGSTVYVNLGVTYNDNHPSSTGEVQKSGVELYFEATTGNNSPPLKVSIGNWLGTLEVQSTIDDLFDLRDDIEAGEDFLDVENMQIYAEYPYGMDDQQRVQAIREIDLMIKAIRDVFSSKPDAPKTKPTPALKPVAPTPEPVAEFTAEDAKNLVARIVHTDMGIEGVDIDNLAYKHWRTEPFEGDSKKTAQRQLKYVKDAIKENRKFQTYLDPKTNILYWTDGYVLLVLSKDSINYVMGLGAKTDGVYISRGKGNKNPTEAEIEKISDDPSGIKGLLKEYKLDKKQQPAEFLYRKRVSSGLDVLVFKDPETGNLVAIDEDKLKIFNPQIKVYLSFNGKGMPLGAKVVDAGEVNLVMPFNLQNISETPPTMVERMRNFVIELRASKISPKKTNYKDVKSIADAIEAALPKEVPAEVAVPEKPSLAPPPAPKPKPLRPKATKPSEVKPDTTIKDPVVREAVYTKEVVDAMAAEAAAKMDAAETAKEKLKAFQEWIDASKKYDAEIARLAIELGPSARARAEKAKIEEKIAELRAIAEGLKPESEAISESAEAILSHPYYEAYMSMDKMLPLDVALSESYPTDIAGFELPVGPEGEGVRLIGPMYYPSGTPSKFFGGIEREVTRAGFRGYQRLGSEHYRDGDRQVIFSLRQVALRMQREISQMVMNEKFRAIIASIGQTASEVLGEDFTQTLYDQATAWADNMPQDSLYARFRAMMAESLGESMPISGIASPGPGVKSQAAVRQWAINFRYGELIGEAMRARGYEAIDPYADIERAIAAQNIKAKKSGDTPETIDEATTPTPDEVTQETMFIPKGMKEKMLEVVVPKDPGKFQQILKGSQKVTSFFKTGTLVFSIPWQIGDLISGMIISTMSGVDPKVLIHYMRQIAREEFGTGTAGLKRMVLPNADYTQFRRGPMARLAGESGVQNLGASMQERAYLYGEELQPERGFVDRISGGRLRLVSEGARAVKGVSFKINETINKILRHAFFLEKLDQQLQAKGQTLESIRNVENWQNDAELKKAVFDAARSANEWLGDYANLTITERKYFTPIFPFWAWIRHIHHVFDMLAVDNPESLFYYAYLGTLASSDEEDPLNLRKGGFSIFGGVASSNWLNPFADVFGGPIGAAVLEQDLRPFGSSMGPVPRLVGGALGVDISRFGALKRPVGTGGYSESGEQTSRSVLPVLGGSVSETIGFTAQQFPIVQRILNINPTPFENIPGTRVALGNVARYQTGEARLSPTTGQRIEQPGGRLASVLRLFGGPFVPYRSDEQINDVLMAARMRLLTLDELQRMRELQGAP